MLWEDRVLLNVHASGHCAECVMKHAHVTHSFRTAGSCEHTTLNIIGIGSSKSGIENVNLKTLQNLKLKVKSLSFLSSDKQFPK